MLTDNENQMVRYASWQDVAKELIDASGVNKEASLLVLRKQQVPHPTDDDSATSALSLPLGQKQSWRIGVQETNILVIREYDDRYEVSLDWVSPTMEVLESLRRQEPAAFVVGTAALGAALGGSAGKSKEAMLVGGLIGGLLGVLAAESAKNK